MSLYEQGLVVELRRNVRTAGALLVLRDRGLGAVVVDQIPYHTMRFNSAEHFLSHARAVLGPMYYYCCPRRPGKEITMTWEQAVATSEFLVETN